MGLDIFWIYCAWTLHVTSTKTFRNCELTQFVMCATEVSPTIANTSKHQNKQFWKQISLTEFRLECDYSITNTLGLHIFSPCSPPHWMPNAQIHSRQDDSNPTPILLPLNFKHSSLSNRNTICGWLMRCWVVDIAWLQWRVPKLHKPPALRASGTLALATQNGQCSV